MVLLKDYFKIIHFDLGLYWEGVKIFFLNGDIDEIIYGKAN